jgi:hypothetical protein
MTAILGTDETMLRTQFNIGNHAYQMREEGGAFLTNHTSQMMPAGADQEGQHWYIIGSSWDLHLPARYSCEAGFTKTHINLTLLLCDWGRRKKQRFFFSRQYNKLSKRCTFFKMGQI